MSSITRLLLRSASAVCVAAAGGGIALGVAAATGNLGKSQTVREIESMPITSAPAAFQRAGSLTIHDVYKRAAPGVVQVTTTSTVTLPNDPFFAEPFQPQTQTQQALGSGFVIDKAGHIVTNYHVVQGAKRIEVSFSNNDSVRATLVGSDPSTDIAVLRVDVGARALTPLSLGDSDTVQVGDSVVAIGNPFGLSRTVTAGIVSALQRPIQAPNGYTIDHVIQTDAALNHGNSGGPLLDASGQVIGVNSQIQSASGSDGNVGIGFAVPINTVKSIASQLIHGGRVERPRASADGLARQAVPPAGQQRTAGRGCPARQRRRACRPQAGHYRGGRRGRELQARRRRHHQGRWRGNGQPRAAARRARAAQARRQGGHRGLPRRQAPHPDAQARTAALLLGEQPSARTGLRLVPRSS